MDTVTTLLDRYAAILRRDPNPHRAFAGIVGELVNLNRLTDTGRVEHIRAALSALDLVQSESRR